MLAGISASNGKNEVIILEKMNSLGRKLKITGKGRCNITNDADMSEFIRFTNRDIIELLKNEGVATKVERGKRVFPVTDKAESVLNALYNRLKKQNVKILTNAKVTNILEENGKIVGVEYIHEDRNENIKADKIILATRRSKL